MFDGRHCVEKDLILLKKETKKVLDIINQKDDYLKQLDSFLKLIERFDKEISEKMRFQINDAKNDTKMIEKIIISNVEILEQNVIVDINEHSHNF